MGEQDSMKDRLYAFLQDCDDGASAETLATQALGLHGARGPVADKVVLAAIDGDARFARTAEGLWRLNRSSKGRDLKGAAFLCLGLLEGAEQVELAARRVQWQGGEALFPAVRIGLDGDQADVLQSFAGFAEGAIPVAFRLPRLRATVNRLGRFLLGRPLLSAGVCLHRLGRRVFPDGPLPDLETLAAQMDLAFVSGRGAEGDASLQVEVLLRLLERCEARGLLTVEAVMTDLYPDPMPVRFEDYAFDEVFLRELPEGPGVYVMRDQAGRVIYVGKAVNLRRRVGSYFARRSERAEKTQRILNRIWSMEVETVGSELEALLLEARLIALCSPEFNTQVAVHDRPADLGLLKNGVLVLPSVEDDCSELFCVIDGGALVQLRVRQDLRDWDVTSERLRRLYYENGQTKRTLTEPEKAELEIARSWVSAHRDALNVVDMEAQGTPDEALRVLSEYVQQCEGEDWERVAWRV